ncbi:MAG TPA: hypothetical protein VKQ34_00750 [Candidatus Saccharimonadales bacterium]|nr:hypothetical protein [Candidatus Saccharimonadales bacterium]
MATATLPEDDQDLEKLEQGGQTNPANIQSHYDREFNDIANNYGDTTAHPLGASEAAGSKANVPAAVGGNKAGGVSDRIGKAGEKLDKVNKALGTIAPEAAVANKLTKVLSFGSQHKKGIAGTIISVALTVTTLVTLTGLIQSEVVTIEKAVSKIAERIQRAEDDHREKSLVRSIARQLKNQVKAKADARAKPDEPLTQEIDSFDANKLNNAMKIDGNTVNIDSAGNVTNVTDPSGNNITDSLENADMTNADKVLANANARVNYVPTIAVDADASFRGLGDPTDPNKDSFSDDEIKKAIVDEIKNGASRIEVLDAAASLNEQNPGGQPNSPDQQAFQDTKNQTGSLNDALKAAEDEFTKTNSGALAEEAGTNAFMEGAAGRSLTVLGVVTTGCSLEQVTQEAANARVPQILLLLMRHAALFKAVVSQILNSKVTAGTVSSFTKLFNGNRGAPPNADGTPSEANLPFTRSVGWQVVTNPAGVAQARANGTPLLYDISSASLPLANGATKLIDKIQQGMNLTGGKIACKALTSKAGVIIQALGGLVQLAADASSLGAAEVATIAANVAFQEYLAHEVVPEIIRYFAVTGLFGTEDSVQLLNNDALGLFLNSGEVGRSMGDVPLTKAQVATLTNQAINDEIAANQRMSLHDRLFAMDNPNSLVANIILRLPTSISAALADLPHALTSLPASIVHSFASILTPHSVFAATTAEEAATPYSWGTTAYGNMNVSKYDPLANEDYLHSTVTANGQTFKRIDALGDPFKFVKSPNGDPNTNDLLHCFVDSAIMLVDNSSGNPNQHFCGTVGSFDGSKAPTIPDDNTAAHAYCAYSGSDNDACASSIAGQMHDEVGHLMQYLRDKGDMNAVKEWANVY